MKVTLNDAVPEDLRPVVEDLVKRGIPGAEVIWLPSRFPRLVMLVEPGAARSEAERGESIFESSASREPSPGAFSSDLEERIQRLLAGRRKE